jgi:uroporphyrinogen decarboxylase
MNKKIIEVIEGKSFKIPPLWMMRQAGRYLPEYKATRKQAGSFLDLCYNPELAYEVTMQPIERFQFDAAILFSDILVVCDALGQSLKFEEGRGPVLEPVNVSDIAKLSTAGVMNHLAPVIETVSKLHNGLDKDITLLGFCGAPWTVATYMIAGHGTPDQAPARIFAHEHPEAFQALLDVLCEASIEYLIAQLDAGADAVQIFDSWASVLDEDQFEKWCIAPVRKITDGIRAKRPNAKIIGFPKGIGSFYKGYATKTGVNMIGLDWTVPLKDAKALQNEVPIQGNLDPLRLIIGGKALDEGVDMVLENLGDGPLVFNLGHGITPQTPIEHVEQMIKRVRKD